MSWYALAFIALAFVIWDMGRIKEWKNACGCITWRSDGSGERDMMASLKCPECKRGIKGRWQMMDEYGGWNNTHHIPDEWMGHEEYMKGRLSGVTKSKQPNGERND